MEGLHPANILTDSEREVMFYLVKGLSNKEIAAGLNISANTVRSYVHVIWRSWASPIAPRLRSTL